MTGRAAKPTAPKWSSRIETSTCPAMVIEMKVAAPSRGAKAAAAVTKTAPKSPPAHTHQGAAESAPRLETTEAQAAGGRGIGEGLARVEALVLQESEEAAVPLVRAGLSDDVDGAARRAAELGREAVVDDLKLADDFRRQCDAGRAGRLVRVVEAVN